MKVNKNILSSAREDIQNQYKPLVEGTYACRFLSANWFEKHKRMSIFLVVLDSNKRLNATVTLGMKFEGKDTTEQQAKKLVALSEAIGSKISNDMEKWANEMRKCAGAPVLATLKPFTSERVQEGYNLVYARKV